MRIIKVIGFNTYHEMLDYLVKENIKGWESGYNNKDKHYFKFKDYSK